MLAMIDNYDSFTYNLVQYFGELGEDVRVFRNDEVTIADLEALKPDFLCVSPGPSVPSNAGISEEAIRHFAGKLPILGVCLGHQAIGEVFGGKIVLARQERPTQSLSQMRESSRESHREPGWLAIILLSLILKRFQPASR